VPDKITFDLKLIENREISIKVFDGDNYMFLPKSQIEVYPPDDPNSDLISVEIPEWLAIKKGLI